MHRVKTLKIFIGFDQAEAVAYHTLCHSILQRSSMPVEFIPIKRSMLKDIHNRPLEHKQSNEFSFTRFLVPYLSNYEGWSLFIDCDMLMLGDVRDLFNLADDVYSVMCVKHEYTPHDKMKYLDNVQYPYAKKNWSSVMLFNNSKCRFLTPGYVNTASGLDLHQFKWLENDDHIGALPVEWNHLVGEYLHNPRAKLVHYTVGGPYFDDYLGGDYSDEWYSEYAQMRHCDQRPVKNKTS